MLVLLVLVTLLTPPPAPDKNDPWADIRLAAGNASLENLKLYVDTRNQVVRVVAQHLDHSWVPEKLRERITAMRPGSPITHYKRARTMGEPAWHKVDVGHADGFTGTGCEIHAPEAPSPDAFTECVIGHGEVPQALMARAIALVPEAKPIRSKKIVRDGGRVTYEVDVQGKGGARASLYVREGGEEAMRRFFLAPGDLPKPVVEAIGKLLPGGEINKAHHRKIPSQPDELMIEVHRRAAIHTLRFDAAGKLRRHQTSMPAIIDVDVFREPGYPDPYDPY